MNEKLKGRYWVCLMFLFVCLSPICAQQYTGMSGLIHIPTADMNREGDARVGGHFMNREFTPDNFKSGGEKYHTTTHYLSITPFRWIEIGYTCMLMKGGKVSGGEIPKVGFYHKDRFFSLKLQPLREFQGKWWPSLAIGTNDPSGTDGKKGTGREDEPSKGGDGKSQYFCNFYLAATKHINLKEHSIGFHLTYRKWKRTYNTKWNGLVGGITFQPSFEKNLRLIAEYTGDDVNVGADYLLWKHLLLQASLQNGKYFSGGICFQINLF